METIGEQTIWTFKPRATECQEARCWDVRKSAAHTVRSYIELATKVAELQFRNRDYVLLFRGQKDDYRNVNKATTIKPSLLRAIDPAKVPTQTMLEYRFAKLQKAERRLVEKYEEDGSQELSRIKRQQILRWSILQHYEVCPTPLLDVTQSLRIAASFASDQNDNAAYVFVLGVPNISGAITASAEADIQTVRLSSVCPPLALRPHIQEGYLLGEYPEISSVYQKQHYKNVEVDFGRRLIAKFKFTPKISSFWKETAFPMVPHEALYPDANDPIYEMTQKIRSSVTFRRLRPHVRSHHR